MIYWIFDNDCGTKVLKNAYTGKFVGNIGNDYMPKSNTPGYIALWIDYHNCVINKWHKRWILIPRLDLDYIANQESNTKNPTHWRYDEGFNEKVLVNSNTGMLSWQSEIPDSDSPNYIPVWNDYPKNMWILRRWSLKYVQSKVYEII
jgi:hypothetical protein